MSKIKQDKKEEIINYYKTHKVSIKQCADIVGIEQHTISKILKEANIEFRSQSEVKRNHINEDFFDKIDSELKAYLLGFLMADGYVRLGGRCNDGYKRESTLNLESIDEYIIRVLNDALSTKDLVSLRKRIINNKPHYIYTIKISSTKLVNSLKLYGIVPNKTGKETFPDTIPDKFKRDFIRGFIDGDGTLGIYSNKPRISIVSTSNTILNSINDYLVKTLKIKNKKLYKSQRDVNCLYLQFCDADSLLKIIPFLYNNTSYYLSRKKQIADTIFNTLHANTEEILGSIS